jgi:hypothetical protein
MQTGALFGTHTVMQLQPSTQKQPEVSGYPQTPLVQMSPAVHD